MNNELDWCQMCGHYQPPYKNNVSNFRECLFCGAVILRSQQPPTTEDTVRVRNVELVAKVAHLEDENYELSNAHARAKHTEEKNAKLQAMIERIIDAGNWLALHYEVSRTELSYDLPSIRIKNWRKLAAEWKEQQ